ncbi:hypothetical protein HOB10_00250 [Candidatus Parcubacteria bacterium]|jgi:hypothetical protein|nr:hypothetical protein [Candidatus Parcubacteria bacterium]
MQGINPQPNIEVPQASPEQAPVTPKQEGAQEQKPEKAPEQITEQVTEVAQPSVVLPESTTQAPAPIVQGVVPPEKIEAVLSEDMDKAFLSMDVATQARFKAEGEQTVMNISTLMQQTKVKTRQVLDLILNWLRIIPQVNAHYLEREAKIKAEKIVNLYKNK